MKGWKCEHCGFSSLVRSNFKFTSQGAAQCRAPCFATFKPRDQHQDQTYCAHCHIPIERHWNGRCPVRRPA